MQLGGEGALQMTDAERQIAKGQLIESYARNEEKIALLRSDLGSIGKELYQLSIALMDTPLKVSAEEAEQVVSVDEGYTNRSADVIKVDGAALHQKVAQLQDAMREKARMESCLKQVGLETLIKPLPQDTRRR